MNVSHYVFDGNVIKMYTVRFPVNLFVTRRTEIVRSFYLLNNTIQSLHSYTSQTESCMYVKTK
jgi:hypothetical protein